MRRRKIKLFFLFFLGLLVFNGHLLAQQVSIKGKVTMETNGNPVARASVVMKKNGKGTSTDDNGNFTLQLNAQGPVVLVASAVGFTEQEITVKPGQTEIEFSLKETSSQGEEIVVVGYSVKSRKSLTGSVVKISNDQIKDMPFASPDQLIQGKASGVQISSMSGTPGGGVTVRVRGTSSFSPNSAASQPLYIIDGVFMNNTPMGPAGYGTEQQISNPLADINPDDIASIEILKDANATSIYGSRGANGVVIITTKRGSKNSRTKVSLNSYYGTSRATKLPKIASGPEVATLLDEIWINNGKPASTKPYPNPSAVPTYDRLPVIFNNNAPTSNFDLNVTGGNDKTTFFIGGSVFNQDGIVRPLSFNRGTFRLNLDHQVNSKLKISTSNVFTRTKRAIVANDNSTGVLLSGLGVASLYPMYNNDGSYNYSLPLPNVAALINENDETSTGVRAISNVYAEYEVIPRMYFKSSFSMDFNDAMNRAFSSTVLNGPGNTATGYNNNNRQVTWINEQTLRYGLNLNSDNTFNFLVGNTVQKTNTSYFGVGASNYPNDDLKYLGSASQVDWWNGGAAENALVSFFGHADYSLKNKYIFDVSARGDGSSRFGANHRWGFFPSAGFAWRVISEDFMKNQRLFSNLKLKTSYGITGSQETISEYASQGLWTGNDNYMMQPGTMPSQLANPDLKWEQTTQFNAGVEFGLLNNRIEGEIDIYKKYTQGVLINKPVPMTTGFSTIAYNGGDISNKGIELNMNFGVIRQKDFTWDLGFNISHNKNLIEKLDAPYLEPFSRKFIIYKQGYPVNGFWLWKQLYVDPQTGDAVYQDVDKNGVIDDNDRMILGNNQPTVFGGLTSKLQYKGFDFSFAFNYELGQSIVNWSTFFMMHGGMRVNGSNGTATWGFYEHQMDRWQKPSDITDVPRVGGPNRLSNYNRYTSRALENGSYERLKAITLGYTIPAPVLTRLHISSLRVYVSATNLLTFTKYTGLDPEINAGGGKGTVGGVEMFTVPQPKTIQGGFNVTF
jgi:TonB-linked SusC/RagA family outer membrane protein